MIRRLFSYSPKIAILLTSLMVVVYIGSFGVALPVTAQASQNVVCQGVGTASGKIGSSCPGSGVSINKVLKEILNILSIAAGFIAVIMIIIGGFRYVISGGNDTSVAAAKDAIIYAIVGIIIVAVAQIIIHIVLNT